MAKTLKCLEDKHIQQVPSLSGKRGQIVVVQGLGKTGKSTLVADYILPKLDQLADQRKHKVYLTHWDDKKVYLERQWPENISIELLHENRILQTIPHHKDNEDEVVTFVIDHIFAFDNLFHLQATTAALVCDSTTNNKAIFNWVFVVFYLSLDKVPSAILSNACLFQHVSSKEPFSFQVSWPFTNHKFWIDCKQQEPKKLTIRESVVTASKEGRTHWHIPLYEQLLQYFVREGSLNSDELDQILKLSRGREIRSHE